MPIDYGTNNVTTSGTIIASTGNFTNLSINNISVSASGHNHSPNDITDFNSSVSGLLPSNLVYTTGNQSVSGIKTFNESVYLGSSGNPLYIGNESTTIQNVNEQLDIFCGNNVIITADSAGIFLNSADLLWNNTQVSIDGHSHSSSDITDFNSSVSGLLSKTFAIFTAQNNQPPSSSFATIDTRNSILVLDFDDASVESAIFMGIIPEGISFPSGIQTSIDWIATSATAGNVRWRVEFEKGNTDYDSNSFDTSAEGNGTANATAGIPITTNITTTSIDSLVAGDLFRLRVSRVGNDATNDTMAGDAELVGIELRRV